MAASTGFPAADKRPPGEVRRPAHCRVLVVDDSPTMRSELSNVLAAGGFEVAGCAVDGLEGVRRYQDLRPDVVLMDVTMPFLDGIEATRRIRGIDPDARVVVICGPCSPDQAREALAVGAVACAKRPLDHRRLLERVAAAMRNDERSMEGSCP